MTEAATNYSFEFCERCTRKNTCYPGPSAVHTECYESHGKAFAPMTEAANIPIPEDLRPTRLEGQAFKSLLRHAEKCDTDPEYSWDSEPKQRRHAMNAAQDLKAAYERIGKAEADAQAILDGISPEYIVQGGSLMGTLAASVVKLEAEVSDLNAKLETAQSLYDDANRDWRTSKAECKALREQVEQFRYGDNYIKQFLDAKNKCAAMYPPEEVYTKGRLELWAEENGYAISTSRAEEKHG